MSIFEGITIRSSMPADWRIWALADFPEFSGTISTWIHLEENKGWRRLVVHPTTTLRDIQVNLGLCLLPKFRGITSVKGP